MIIAERQSLLSSELSSAETRAQFMHVMNKVLREFDLDHVTIFSAPGPNDSLLAPLVLESTIPVQFVREFDRNQLLRACPVLPRLRDTILPQFWDLDPNTPSDFDWPPKMHALMRRYNLLMGALIPMNSVDSNRFFMRFDGKRPPFCQVESNELGMIALHAFDHFDRMRRTELASPNVLSARELEVLRWTAQGKTSIEIGQILSLSDHTVNAYMTNAIKKLDCVNRTQLVAKAIRLKLIN
ncbi:LuxR family transcriptional regulator [Agrobacterium sp. a22-2]|uniref:helix-turn-helix transcriptional regulator n=1 Tax=Agrobacterium sp. a22-2 TaxID=2283840 RepID=UPI0014460AD2|nr:LuxR family transcriptional regulator [Agrobacterium sp. a22-2]NKN39721.1 LuxR family transcriptional regulator [Agrobacterium sp. a22-2]